MHNENALNSGLSPHFEGQMWMYLKKFFCTFQNVQQNNSVPEILFYFCLSILGEREKLKYFTKYVMSSNFSPLQLWLG